MRLEVVERLEAVLAPVLRLARRGPEARQLARASRAAARAGNIDGCGSTAESRRVDRLHPRRRARAGRRDAEAGEPRSSFRCDPVGGPRGRELDLEAMV